MPIFNPAHLTGKTIRPSMIHSGFNSMKDKEEEKQPDEMEGTGLEKITDKLEKFSSTFVGFTPQTSLR